MCGFKKTTSAGGNKLL